MSDVITAIDDDEQVAQRTSRAAVPPIRPTDGERLMQFWRHRDEAALAEVIELHAGMVWGVCSQVLRRREDIEDAFQATFLILARKARSIRAADSAAGWLYRVAFRTALLARSRRNRLAETALEYEPAASDDDQLEAIARSEQCRVLLEELHALPLQYRQPLVLCYLEGRSRSEAADELGVTPQSVKGRLARGTRLLRSRMAGRGVALSTTMAITTASIAAANAATPNALVPHTAALAASFTWKLASAGANATAAKATAATLAEKGLLSMTLIAAAKPAVAVLGLCLTAGMFAIATADAPSGEGPGGEAVLLLASADIEAGADAAEDQSVEPADVAISAPNEEEAGEPAEDELLADDISVQVDGESPTVRAGSDTDTQITGVIAPADVDGPWQRVGPVAPAAPAEAPQPARAPAASAFSFAGSADPFAAAGDRLDFTLAQQAPQFRMQLDAGSIPRLGSSSQKSLELEQEYWELKAKGLKLKADAMRQKAESMQANGTGPQTEVLEIKADAALIEADLKLCELNKLRVDEQLDAMEATRLRPGSTGVQVSMLQQQLNALLQPSPKLEVDGEFGPLTEKAVKRLQEENQLEPSGVVDEKTAAVLNLRLPSPRDVLVPAPMGLPPTITYTPTGGGGGVMFGGRTGEPPNDAQPATTSTQGAESSPPSINVARAAALAKARQIEANAFRQQAHALRSALDALQTQQQAAEEAARRAEEAARAAEEQQRAAR